MRAAIPCLAVLLLLAACDKPAPGGVDIDALNNEVASAVGDPATCVVLAEKATGKVVYRLGEPRICRREFTDCRTPPAILSADALLQLAVKGDERAESCDIQNGESRVGWASGPVTTGAGAKHGPLVYAVNMEGVNALPGREIKARLEPALAKAGL
jgi:hypothetical protein